MPKALVAKALEEATTKGHIALVTAVERLFLEAERMELDVPTYSALMEKLVLDPCSYRPTAVRLLLNLALAKVRCSLRQATGSSRTWVGVGANGSGQPGGALGPGVFE